MANFLKDLLLLQTYEGKRRDHEKALQILQQEAVMLADEKKKFSSQLNNWQEQLTLKERENRQIEIGLVDLEGKLKAFQNRLEMAQNVTQSRAVEKEIEALKKRQDELESQQLEGLYAIDQQGEQVDGLMQEKVAREKIWLEREAYMGRRKEQLQSEILDCREKLDILRRDLPPRILRIFDRVASSARHFPLLVELDRRFICGGCHTRLSEGFVQDLRVSEDGFFPCEFCGRLLYETEIESLTVAE